MSQISPSARALVERIKAEPNALELNAFQENEVRPFEFRWGWTGRIGEGEYTYQRKALSNVIGQDAKKASRSGRGGGGGATGMASLVIDCPLCNHAHSPIADCI